MAVRKADAVWKGSIQEGEGTIRLGSGAFEGQYSFGSRFAEGVGTNPEELIGAAHAGCFTMALSGGLGRAGFTPARISTVAKVHIDKVDDGFQITKIELENETEVPGIDDATFQEIAQKTKDGCPVSKALAAVGEITLTAKLLA